MRKESVITTLIFFINGEIIEIVDSFVYLGMKLTRTGTFKVAIKTLHEQALRAYYNLLSLFDRVVMDVKTKMSLFDSMVLPILLYGAEIWGVYNIKNIDNLHAKFCKYILGVKSQTPNYAVFGELGRIPLSVLCKVRAIKFWIKIMKNPDSAVYSIYLDQCSNINGTCWANQINSLIDRLGFTNVRLHFDKNQNYFPTFKSRLYDQFFQEWSTTINAMPKLDSYCKYKTNFHFEEYITKIDNSDLRKHFTSLRLSSHSLEIETGRYHNIQRNSRLCKLCQQKMVESEYHFILCCTKYSDLRKKYLGNIQWPTLQKFYKLMSAQNKKMLVNIAKYIKEATQLRKQYLE